MLTDNARAYGGQAHGSEWRVDVEPPVVVWLPSPVGLETYRVALNPKTGTPARDYIGNFLYIPATAEIPDD
jgi:hypothetical protein